MGHFLNFGAGPNQLPEPWQNLNAEHDIRKRLRFEDGSATRIHCEHVIEHVPFLHGFRFLGECLRVLEPCGVLRLSFPDASRFLARVTDPMRAASIGWAWGPMAARYAETVGLREANVRQATGSHGAREAACGMLLTAWNHQAGWTEPLAAAVLLTTGFRFVYHREYGEGFAGEADGHHKDVGRDWAILETSILEAEK